MSSSPIVLIEALYFAKRHNGSITILDERSNLGGAWQVLGIDDPELQAEIGAHLIGNQKNAYVFMRKHLGWRMVEVQPEPVIVFNTPFGPIAMRWRLRFIFNFIRILIYSGYRLGLWSNKEFNPHGGKPVIDASRNRENVGKLRLMVAFFRNFKRQVAMPAIEYMCGKTPRFCYPDNGCAGMLGSLVVALSKMSSDIRLETRVSSVQYDVEGDFYLVDSDDDRKFKTKSLFITPNCHIPKYIYGAEMITPSYKKKIFHQLILLVSAEGQRRFSYARFYDSELLIRAVDQGEIQGSDSTKRILTIESNVSPTERPDVIKHIISELIKLRLLDRRTQLLKSTSYDYVQYELEHDSRERLLKKFPKFNVIDTSDFAGYFSENYSRLSDYIAPV